MAELPRGKTLPRASPRPAWGFPGVLVGWINSTPLTHVYAFKRFFYPLTPIGCPAGGKDINASLEAHLDPPQPSTRNDSQGLPDFILNAT